MSVKLNKILNNLDEIIFIDKNENDNNISVKLILDNVRKYIINSYENSDIEDNRESFKVLLQFINYLIQESDIITFRFINQIIGLRYLILNFEENTF